MSFFYLLSVAGRRRKPYHHTRPEREGNPNPSVFFSEKKSFRRREAARMVELAKELQDSAFGFVSKTWNEEQLLHQRALVLESNLKKLRSSIDDAIARGAIDRSVTDKLHEELYVLTDGDVASLLPSKTQ